MKINKAEESTKIILKVTAVFSLFIFLWALILYTEGTIHWTSTLSGIFLQMVFGVVLIVLAVSMSFIFISKGVFRVKDLEDKLSTNEQLYQHVINNTTMGLWKFDFDARQCSFPPNWKQYLGYEESDLDEALGTWIGLVHKDDIEILNQKFNDYSNKITDRLELVYRVRRKDGSWVWVEALGTGLWSSDGKLKKMLVTHTDQTARINAQKELMESEEKFRTIFNSANDAMVLIELSGSSKQARFMEVNNIVMERYGYTRDEVMNLSPNDFLIEPDRGKEEIYIKEIVENSNSIIETIHETKSGDRVPVEISHHSFMLGDKSVVFCIARDITERKKTEEKLKSIISENENLLQKAIESERVKTEFFCNISHEFKTPLNIILGVIQLIEPGKAITPECIQTNNYYKYISILRQNCLRILRLVNNLLEINKIDADYMELNLENHNIVSLVENITLSVAEFVNNKGLTLVFDTSTEEKMIACDAYKIERIMLNLLSNSIKYSKSDTSIHVNIQDNEDNVLISVKDTGIGIPREKLGTIFNRFTQVDSSLTRKCEGSGIGLSIVKSYVEMHGGKIWAESEYGTGTEFFIELPARVLPGVAPCRADSDRGSGSSIGERINIEFSDIYSN